MNFYKALTGFKACWTLYYVIISFFFGILISAIDKMHYIDGLFTAASAMSGAGLTVVSVSLFSSTGFILTATLMLLGSAGFMLLPTILYRRYCFQKVDAQLIAEYRSSPSTTLFTPENLRIIEESYLIYESLYLLTNIILLYYTLWMVIGMVCISNALQIYPLQAELQERGYSYLDNAVYLTVSAFANTGFTITSDSLIGIDNNPTCYIVISILIIAGNTALPIFLRYFILFLRTLNRYWCRYIQSERPNRFSIQRPYEYYFNYETVLTFILRHPRSLTTHLFTDFQTLLLVFMVLQLIVVQYVFFCLSVVFQPDLRRKYPLGMLLGIGYFQTLSTRSAGFAMMDLRELNQGLLFVYCIMMYLSSFPFVSTLHNSNRNLLVDVIGPEETERWESDKLYPITNNNNTTTGDNELLPSQSKESSRPDEEQGGGRGVGAKELTQDDHHQQILDHNLSRILASHDPYHHYELSDAIKALLSKNRELYQLVMRSILTEKEIPRTRAGSHVRREEYVEGEEVEDPVHNPLLLTRRPSHTRGASSPSPPNTGRKGSTTTAIDDDLETPSELTMSFYQPVNEKDNYPDDIKSSATTPSQAAAAANESIDQQFAKRYFFRHTFFLIAALLILAYSEDQLMATAEYGVNLWFIMFEMISAYGSVGLSLGIPGKSYSLSGQMSLLGKCVMIFVMFLGKHRGLPNNSDEVIDFRFEKFQQAYRSIRSHHKHHVMGDMPVNKLKLQLPESRKGRNASSKKM